MRLNQSVFFYRIFFSFFSSSRRFVSSRACHELFLHLVYFWTSNKWFRFDLFRVHLFRKVFPCTHRGNRAAWARNQMSRKEFSQRLIFWNRSVENGSEKRSQDKINNFNLWTGLFFDTTFYQAARTALFGSEKNRNLIHKNRRRENFVQIFLL